MTPLGLRVDGLDFRITDGKVLKLPMVSDFALFPRWMAEGRAGGARRRACGEWDTIAKEGGYLGPIMLRAFRHAAGWNRFALNPNDLPIDTYKTGIRAFVEDRGSFIPSRGRSMSN